MLSGLPSLKKRKDTSLQGSRPKGFLHRKGPREERSGIGPPDPGAKGRRLLKKKGENKLFGTEPSLSVQKDRKKGDPEEEEGIEREDLDRVESEGKEVDIHSVWPPSESEGFLPPLDFQNQ
jgi:hypothetical protein